MEELVIKAQKGDDSSFDELIRSLKKELYLIAKTRLSNDEDIADCLQETIINAYQNIKRIRHPEFFKTWIIKILINECNKFYKKNKVKIVSLDDNNMEKYISNGKEIESNLSFESMMKLLKQDEQIILTLYYVSGYNTKEISKIVKINENTIRTKMMRAKNKLKNIYEGGDF